ncbi:unnamed protein product [Brachionus calyciflorus]|uniref:Uncharacterized protein n=1 Tax=Brachionus calyciflorus TaxID=104777 RepID=A0A813SSE6_9BILA|nr:unnamed protein product [Brachionus calyciflorus]
MLNDDYVQNAILHRPNSKSNRAPFLIPLNDSTSTFSNFYAPSSKDKSTTSRKSVKLIRPETLKRAVTDACMAAAIGDLEWLKQTFKISAEKAFDKDGFATIHLAAIHGRLNIIKYLVEEQNFDPNFPSAMHCWYPIHLCISNQIGSRAVECLKYLLEKGADINVKNTDDIYPLHMAASEGQVDCLKILLDLKPNARVTDRKGQTPLDLAKLWGHKTCAKMLSSYMWTQEKKEKEELKKAENKLRTQDILKEIERAHFSIYVDKEESEKKFDTWLISQGFDSEGHLIEPPPKPEKEKKEYNLGLKNILLIPDETESKITTNSKLDSDSKTVDNKSSSYKTKRKEQKLNDKKIYHPKEWNYSTKPPEKNYITNLKDFFPRDPHTQLPLNLDLVMLNKELKGMSLEQVKEFMRKNLKSHPSTPSLKSERPVYFKPKNIVDAQAKIRSEEYQLGIDNAGLFLGDDIDSFGYKQARNFIRNNYENLNSDDHVSYYENAPCHFRPHTVKKYIDDKLEIVKNTYGEGLADFMMDRRSGKMRGKYEKVFIS